jgi:alpha-beta hydrolase superfamily lysophospholipase
MSDRSFQFKGNDGTPVTAYRWPAEGPVKAVLQIAHGMGEHALRYEEPLRPLRKAGVAIYANDHRGHGKTGPTLGDFGPGGFSGVVDDMAVLSGIARKENPGRKLILLGHSMGSFALQIYLVLHSKLIDAAVISGSACLDMLPPPDPSGNALEAFNKPFEPARTPFDWLSRDKAEVDKYIADPLCGFSMNEPSMMSLFVAAQPLFAADALKAIRPELPIYLIAGDKDPLNAGLTALTPLVQRYRDAGVKDVTHDFYKDGRHEMLNETNRDEVVRNLGAFVARVAS